MSDLHRTLAGAALRLVPPDKDGRMYDKASSALQFACMALVALGVAQRRPYGCDLSVPSQAVPDRIDPTRLWTGDAAVVLLGIARQLGDLSTPQDRARADARPRPGVPPSINPDAPIDVALPDGALSIAPQIAAPFVALGWIHEGRWTDLAQETLWRAGILTPSQDALGAAVAAAQAKMPQDVAQAVASVRQPPDTELLDQRAGERHARTQDMLANMPAAIRARVKGPTTRAQMRDVVLKRWPDDAARRVTDLLQDRWRLSLGWDSGAPLIPLFHDRLANAVSAGLTGAR